MESILPPGKPLPARGWGAISDESQRIKLFIDMTNRAKNSPGDGPNVTTAAPTTPSRSPSRRVNKTRDKEKPSDVIASYVGPFGKVKRLVRRACRDSPSWLSSLVVHAIIIVLFALLAIPASREVESAGLRFAADAASDDLPQEMAQPENATPDVEVDQLAESLMPETDLADLEPDLTSMDAMASAVELVDFGSELSPDNILNASGSGATDALAGRGATERAALVRRGGGTSGSEEAVNNALEWLANHQLADGGWNLDHGVGDCNGRCRDPGTHTEARIGATALALLPFLGAGHTHVDGDYKRVVGGGLDFLLKSMKVSTVSDRKGRGRLRVGSLWEPKGYMYSHGLATVVLCEVYAMTEDKKLAEPAQLAINFIEHYQDPNGGGWRYQLPEAGSISVVGWQVLALKSADMGGLSVQPSTAKLASHFFDSVQSDEGASYRYLYAPDGDEFSRNQYTMGRRAIGLLCRMYLGWKKDNPALNAGVERIARSGPSESNFYSNYYATQVLFQFTGADGPIWEKWNERMRDQLVNSQATEDHERGSWMTGKGLSQKSGGRLFCTAMATMTLEIYYRYMPIYGAEAVTDEFPE